MTTTYLTQAAMEQVDHAQVELERHLVTGATGRCVTCRQPEPCSGRTTAEATFARYGRLPHRRPGMTTVIIIEADQEDGTSSRSVTYTPTPGTP